MTTLAEALSALDGKASLTVDDALTLRRIIYGQNPGVDQMEADAEWLIGLAGDDSSRFLPAPPPNIRSQQVRSCLPPMWIQ